MEKIQGSEVVDIDLDKVKFCMEIQGSEVVNMDILGFLEKFV